MDDKVVIQIENADGSVEKITRLFLSQDDDKIIQFLLASGYDCNDPYFNCYLASQGGHKTALYIDYKQRQSLISKKEESQKDTIETSVPTEIVQPLIVPVDISSKIERVPTVGNSFWIGDKILLGSDSGIGKTLFSIYLCTRAFGRKTIRKACFFTPEDRNGKQAPRYTEGLKDYPFTVVGSEKFDQEVERINSDAENKANFEAVLLNMKPELKRLEHNLDFTQRKHGVSKKKMSPKFIAFLNLLREKIEEGYDFIVLDSLSEILENTNQISRDIINKFLELPLKTGVTFVVLHHLNGKKTLRGSKDLLSCFESVYILEEVEKENHDGVTLLRLNVEKKRYDDEESLLIKRTRVTVHTAGHKLLKSKESQPFTTAEDRTFKNKVLEYIREAGQKGCSFDDLFRTMKEIKPTTSRDSVQNILRRLRVDGKVEAVDKPWHLVRAL